MGKFGYLLAFVIPCFHLLSNVFSSTMLTKLSLPHPLILGLTHYISCGELLDPLGIHLFQCAYGGERIASHDAVWDAFASIVRNAGFHVLWEQTHILPLPFLQSSCQRIKIVLLVDGIRILADVIIVDPTQADLVSRTTFSCGVVATMVAQVKEGLYYDHYPLNMFFLLAIKVFGCLHQ